MEKKLFTTFGREQKNSSIVLVSGGVDSSILLALEAGKRARVCPIFIRAGFRFEDAQRRSLDCFIKKLGGRNIQKVTELKVSAVDFFPKTHWAFSGRGIPPLLSPDGSCYLPGWNLLLLAPTLVFAAQKGISRIVLGHIAHNPYPDGQPSFFKTFERLAELAFESRIRIERPFEKWSKADVLKKGRPYPLEVTMTCIDPRAGRHCGRCHKCAERHRGFLQAGIRDDTSYAADLRL